MRESPPGFTVSIGLRGIVYRKQRPSIQDKLKTYSRGVPILLELLSESLKYWGMLGSFVPVKLIFFNVILLKATPYLFLTRHS